VAHDHLHKALDRFAAFFSCPLFTESCTEREMKAVDSENTGNLQRAAPLFDYNETSSPHRNPDRGSRAHALEHERAHARTRQRRHEGREGDRSERAWMA
jgi:hypothetical protein